MAGKKPLFSADAAEEYFSTLLTYYRNTGNNIFKQDNEGRHVSDQIYSAEYQKYLGMQIAMREVLEYFAKFELGDTALRQQETATNRNELLTLDELQQEIEKLRAQLPRWIPVTERLPEERVLVNVLWVNRDPESYYEKIKGIPFSDTACFYRERWYWDSPAVIDLLAEYGKDEFDLVDDAVEITHWMPLPEPPEV